MKFRKFTLKHITLISLLPALAVWGVLTALTASDPANAGYTGLASVLVLFATSFALRKYHSSYMKKAERSLYDDCDPYPTIEELNLYLECAGRRVNKTGLRITLAMMLALTGDYDTAEKTLTSFNVGEGSPFSEIAKAGILYDLAALYCAMSLPEHAIDCYERSKEHFAASPESVGGKMRYNGTTDAEIECYKGNTGKALDILDSIDADNRFREVMKTFALAKVHYIAGAREEAISEFDWVAANGGLLACAKESEQIAAAARAV